MGFRPEPTVYKLVFEEDTGLAGLTVRAKCCSMGEFNAMLRGSQDPEMDDIPDDLEDPEELAKAAAKMREYSKAAASANDEAVAMFQKYLVDWDLEDENGPVPTTMEGIQSVEKPIVAKVIAAWHTAMMAVPVPLKKASSDGRRSEEATLGLENLSESQPSWPTPN